MYLILKMKDGKRWFCCKAIGGRYYHRLAQILDDDEAADLAGPAPQGRLIVEEDNSYVVTMPGSSGGDKLPWVRCANLEYAEKMVSHAK